MISAQDIPNILPDSIPTKAEELQMLKSMPIDELINKVVGSMVTFSINLTIAIVVFIVGKFIISKVNKLITAILIKRRVDRSLSTFLLSLIRMVLYFILIVTVIGILGIETSSFIALFASAGVAIGMALSGTLQNFAGGVLILLLKPYKVGDFIEAEGFAGKVKEIQIFNTVIVTVDNKSIIIPNGNLSNNSINNYSREKFRRVDWDIAISYGDDVDTARNAILSFLAADDRIITNSETAVCCNDDSRDKPDAMKSLVPLPDMRPVVLVKELADSSVTLTVRAWTCNENYWSVFYDFNEKFYKDLPYHGINFPFPQLDVHLKDKES